MGYPCDDALDDARKASFADLKICCERNVTSLELAGECNRSELALSAALTTLSLLDCCGARRVPKRFAEGDPSSLSTGASGLAKRIRVVLKSS